MNSILRLLLIGILSTYNHLSFSSSMKTLVPDAFTAPAKGELARLGAEDLQKILFKHESQLNTIGITPNNAEFWYAIANEYRHLLTSKEALRFAQKVYMHLIESQDNLSADLRSISSRNLSKLYRRNGEIKTALQCALKALKIGQQTPSYGQTLCYVGDFYRLTLHNAADGCRYYLQALEWCPTNNNQNVRAQAFIGLGNARYTDNQHRNNADWYLEARRILGSHGDITLQATALIGLGNARHSDIQHRKQADWYLEALRVLGSTGEITLQAQALIGLGNARYTDNQHDRNHWYLEALGILGSHGDIDLQAQALIGLGNARYTDNQHENNADWYLEALGVLGTHGDISLQAQALIGLGNARYTDHRHDRNYWYREALKVLGDRGDVDLQARALIGLGNARYTDNRHKNDIDWYLEARRVLGIHGDVTLQAQALIGLGNAHCSQRDNRTGLDYFRQALEIAPNSMKNTIRSNIARTEHFLNKAR